MPTDVPYPTGRSVAFNTGVGLHDLAILASGNGWSASSIVACPGGGQENATPVTSAVTLIAVCDSLNDSVQLPPAMGGQLLWVFNAGDRGAAVFPSPNTTDIINTAGIVGDGRTVTITANGAQVFISPVPGAWFGMMR